MTVETFKEIANRTLSEYTKGKDEKYGWSDWWPERTPDTNTIVFDYRATLWKGDDDSLIDTMLMPKNLTEEQAVVHINKWLDEKLED